jgi:predicted NBD/HSP70 family sugar kinase
MGLAADLAEHLQAERVPLADVNAAALAEIVRGATTPGAA